MSAGGAAAAPVTPATSAAQARSAPLISEVEVRKAVRIDRPNCIKRADAQHELTYPHEPSARTAQDARCRFNDDGHGTDECQDTDHIECHQHGADVLVSDRQ